MPRSDPLDYESLSVAASAVGFASIPSGAVCALISVEGGDIRWRDDGSDPTSAEGIFQKVGSSFPYSGSLAAIKFIRVGANTATLKIGYYRLSEGVPDPDSYYGALWQAANGSLNPVAPATPLPVAIYSGGVETPLTADYSLVDDDAWPGGPPRGIVPIYRAAASDGTIDALDAGDSGAPGIWGDIRAPYHALRAYKRGGATPYYRRSSADVNNVVINAGPCQIFSGYLFNRSAAAKWVRFYNMATAPGTGDTPVHVCELGVGPFAVRIADPVGLEFTTGLGIRITGAEADNDNTAVAAGDVRVNLGIKA